MAGRCVDAATQQTGIGMKRRGILAAAGAVVAGIVAQHTRQQVAAAASPLLFPAQSGDASTTNTAFAGTYLKASTSASFGGGVMLEVDATPSTDTASFNRIDALHAKALGYQARGLEAFGGAIGNGIYARGGDGLASPPSNADAAAGIHGVGGTGSSSGNGGIGLWGDGGASPSGYGGTGVYGAPGSGKAAIGVYGFNGWSAAGGIGVYGKIDLSSSGANTVAVYGLNIAQASGGIGVRGHIPTEITTGVTNTAANTVAVQGLNQSSGAGGFGVYGSSGGGPGVFGTTTAAQNAGLAGIVSTPGTAAFAGTSTNPNAFAGFFTGDVFVNGNFTVNDPTRKHGAIAHPDGSYRILYSMESPESWLEDFGVGQLVGGKADVRLDADFAAVVQTGEYHVFLTPYDGVGALRAARRTAAGFAVEEIGGASSGGFSYRVVARPKTTNKATRLAKFTIPDIKVPQPPPMPDVPVGKVPDAPPQPVPPPRPASSTVSPAAAPSQGGATNPVQPAPPPRP